MNEEDVDSHILIQYEIVKVLGKGAYGIVWQVIERTTGTTYALKKIIGAFLNPTDAQRTFREVFILKDLGNHEGVIQLEKVMKADNDVDLYLLFEYMESDLLTVIRASILQPIHKIYILYQLLHVMNYIHSANIVHRDLKPNNLLLNSQCFLKVADFGLARSIIYDKNDKRKLVVTDYVATRWYRAPEILLGAKEYKKEVDMWSIGCIMGELLSGDTLFPGKSTMNQVDRILELTGTPSEEDIKAMKSDFAATLLDSLQDHSPGNLRYKFSDIEDDAIDIMEKMLQFNPNSRISCEEALEHPYLDHFRESIPPVSRGPMVIPIDDWERKDVDAYRSYIYENFTEEYNTDTDSLADSLGGLSSSIDNTLYIPDTDSSSEIEYSEETSDISEEAYEEPKKKRTKTKKQLEREESNGKSRKQRRSHESSEEELSERSKRKKNRHKRRSRDSYSSVDDDTNECSSKPSKKRHSKKYTEGIACLHYDLI
eukprot:TRINITY_DN4328_c0_g1_i2.p1 TRINITY_DN4328_c0_g1~~TRINITY_DN4328_c0_g1_i2.p1  ORF type:complete len:484 (+),score=125.13 TRINITY_DN4328_c0_g1_i2:26-1477(+)